MSKYDIFISYRRSASDFAQLVASHLKSAGYRVFIDIESLRSGKFNTQLFDVIDSCKDFVIILPEGGLDRCSSPDDWVRMEYERAAMAGKNIVPVLLSGFTWPSPMPEGMEELKDYQGLSATSAEYYDLSIKRLRGYLKSRPHSLLRKVLLSLAGIIGGVLLLLLAAEGILSVMSGSLYTRIADKLTNQACILDLLGDSNEAIDDAWDSFTREYDAPGRMDILAGLDGSLEDVLSGLEPLRKQLGSSMIELTRWESFLVSLKDISPEELALSEPYIETFFDDIEDRVALVRDALADGEPSLMDKDLIAENGDVFRHCSNSYYYGYLSVISLLPEKSRKRYDEMVSRWRHFPNGVGLNHTQQEYEQFIQKEYSDLQRYNYDLSKRVLQVQQKYEEYLLQFDNEASRLVSLYDGVLAEARDSLGSDAYRDWIRIVMVSSFIPDLVEHESDPETLPIPLKAAGVADDVSSLLKDYSAEYPYLLEAAVAAGAFYKAVSTGALPYRGLVVSMASGQEGLSAGDLAVKVNGIVADTRGVTALSEVIASGRLETLEVLTIDGGRISPARTVTPDRSKGHIILLPLVPFGD